MDKLSKRYSKIQYTDEDAQTRADKPWYGPIGISCFYLRYL
jgi:hypothetical protein